MSSRILSLLTAACLALYLATTSALASTNTTTHPEFTGVNHTSTLTDDPKCPKGYRPGFQYNAWQYVVHPSEFINVTGSFLHQEWYSGPLSWSEGPDNTIGTVRAELFEDNLFVERLVGHYRSPTQSVIRFRLENGPVRIREFKVASYTEEHRVMNICGGKAVFFIMTVVYCADNEPAAYNIFDRYRRETVQGVADAMGALSFGGTCPH